ncbi:hypothetical protein [Hoeflea poritis]|uniref:Uncharacterized protein n=1 Tax=Hoeflea poritis TaxID=2993659 RepID=A0ABT4VNZ5_9HYPH|nr:hypothetical protein [Hoeflea poritis]MDA4846404.1 hypothetical protein [Hoeflea poritis]
MAAFMAVTSIKGATVMKTHCLKLALSAAIAASVFAGSAGYAHASYCEYRASDTKRIVARGGANARKMSTACKRARRECNRRLDRETRKGKVGRGAVCRRVQFG